MSRPTVFVALQQFCESDDRPLRLLHEAGWNIRRNDLGRRLKAEEMLSLLQGAEAVLAGVEPYDARLLEQLPKLRCISRCGSGTDSVDLEEARRRGISVLTTPDEVVEPVAQLTLGMVLALARGFPQSIRSFDAGKWSKQTGFLLSEWTIGLVGFGRIGRRVEQLLRPMGPRILVCDPSLPAGNLPPSVQPATLEELLTQADLVSIHVSRRPEEGLLFGKKEIARMKRGSFLVNTARGYLVDEQALAEGLSSGGLAGAAFDVFEKEPCNGPLTKMPQVLCTPHVATLTRASRTAMELRCAKNVIEFFGRTWAA